MALLDRVELSLKAVQGITYQRIDHATDEVELERMAWELTRLQGYMVMLTKHVDCLQESVELRLEDLQSETARIAAGR